MQNQAKAQHTPGPWGYTLTTLSGKPIDFKIVDEKHGSTKPICAAGDGFTCDEYEANARLIAAAPLLLSSVLEFLDALPPLEIQTVALRDAADYARAAIAKVEGR